jgi:hypothetical protein
MSIFLHPHLTRGIVKTPGGAFVISRGRVEMPADLGASLGWRLVDDDDETPAAAIASSRDSRPERQHIGVAL